ncbi:MAG: multidrug efflux RND transporter permease subunit [Gammaproteobacteria bacterium]|nr:multidrug efflux RND transporter permease subunit [Gammaproteobacteria bacterium]
MNFIALFIARPVATTLLTLGIAVAGVLAFLLLPVAPLPQIDFPSIMVQAALPGANPETMASTVAAPLERSLGRIAGVTEMTSSSALGTTNITLQFDLDRDIDGAANDVQAAINAARALLPSGLPSNPTWRKINPADSPVMVLALRSAVVTQGQLYDVAASVLAQRISQVEGIGQVTVGGSALPAVRVAMKPAALNHLGLSTADVRHAITTANVNLPKGALSDGARRWQIEADTQLQRAADYKQVILRYQQGAAVRLGDVAEVEDSVQDVRNAGFAEGRTAVLLILSRQPGANIIEVVDRVNAMLPQLRAMIAADIDLSVVMDRTPTIRASLNEVEHALMLATVLVVTVVFLFLRNGRAALIPSVAVPVSLLGTFAVMHIAGFSLNTISLMALTVATGFVVDDAVVVLENVARHIDAGRSPREAALLGAREVASTVVSMSASLVAVFIPILLMGGLVGRLLREFSVTLAAAVLVSLVISLTTTPMMCARLLRADDGRRQGRFMAAMEWAFEGSLAGYRRSLDWALRHRRLVLLSFFATVAFNVHLYMQVPKGFMPEQDTGKLMGFMQADQGISFQAMRDKMTTMLSIIRRDRAVETTMGVVGGQRGGGQVFVALKPLAARHHSASEVIARLRPQLAKVAGATLYLQPVQDVRAGGRAGNAQYQYTLRAQSVDDLRAWAPRVLEALRKLPALADLNSDQQDKAEQVQLVVDRDAIARLGITQRDVDETLNDLYGQRLVSTIYTPDNQYRVVLEGERAVTASSASLADLYLINAAGESVPLMQVARVASSPTSLNVNHQGQFAATTFTFNLAPGESLSDATRDIKQALAQLALPAGIEASFQGTAKVFQDALANQVLLIIAALASVYIVLGILYESYIHPLTILSTLPSAGVGALLALELCHMDFSLIALIGVILLIGIVKKNAIMMVDFAQDARRERRIGAEQAIREACVLRYRPILMTTVAAMFGALPLALGAGDGAELRRPLGVSIVGGLALSQLLTLYTTPVIYLYLDRLSTWPRRWRAARSVQA